MKTYFRLFTLLQGSSGQILLKVALGLLVMATYVGQAFAAARAMKLLFIEKSFYPVIPLLAMIAVLIVVRAFLLWLDETYGKKIASVIKNRLRERLLKKLLDLGPGYQENYRSGNLQSVLIDGVESIEPFLTGYIPQLLMGILGAGGIIAYIWTLDWVLGLIVAAGVLIAVLSPQFGSNIFGKIILEYWLSYAKLNAQYIDALQGMTTLKMFQASGLKGKELEKEARSVYNWSMQSLGVSLLDSTIVKGAGALGAVLATGVGALRVAGGSLAPADLFVVLFLAVECFRPLIDLNKYWHQSFLGFAAARGIFALLDEKVIIEEKSKAGVAENPVKVPSLEFRGVSFAYAQGTRPAVKDISLQIRPGEKVAFVGKSGSGKSTLVNLILRFFDPQSGEILLDGRKLEDYPLSDLRSWISVVFQDTYLFYGTVAENLRIAKPEASLAELERAARLAGAHEFIRELPQGYDTVTGERGVRLSGGQKQRIAIARAFLKDAPLLILDEATSNVDSQSEGKIQHALEHLMENKTTLIIAHRLSTIQNADRIFVMEDQVVQESGTHGELLRKKGLYTQLIEAQHG